MGSMKLAGRVALVTGGASGIGEAVACKLAEDSARVVIADVQADRGIGVAHWIKSLGGEATFAKHDVTDPKQWTAVMSSIQSEFGRLDILINNAGMMLAALLEDTSVEEWNQVVDVNLSSVFYGMKHAYELMRLSGGGVIVNISSTAGLRGTAYASAYAASKAGVTSLSRSAARQWAQDGSKIRVNVVHPGPIETPAHEKKRGAAVRQFGGEAAMKGLIVKTIPMGHFGEPEDVAESVGFLVSDAARFITGASLSVDGGHSA